MCYSFIPAENQQEQQVAIFQHLPCSTSAALFITGPDTTWPPRRRGAIFPYLSDFSNHAANRGDINRCSGCAGVPAWRSLYSTQHLAKSLNYQRLKRSETDLSADPGSSGKQLLLIPESKNSAQPTASPDSRHLIEQPMLEICSAGPLPVLATCDIALNRSRLTSAAAVSLRLASSRPRYCNCRSAL